MPDHIFISHSSKDDGFVQALRKSLEIQKPETWVDSRELAPGDELEPAIKKATQDARVSSSCLVTTRSIPSWY